MRSYNRVNQDWETPKEHFNWEHVAVEVLMDIRAELRAIRRLAECPNVQRGFIAMQKIEKNTRKKKAVKR